MTGRTEKGARNSPRLNRQGGSDGRDGWDNLPPSNPPPTGEEFDALTDLFLGEVGASAADSPRRVEPESPAPAKNGRSQPVLRLAGTDEELDLEEAPAVAAAAEIPARPVARDAEPMTDAIVECIVLGHLPVLAAAWGAQYVREIAQATGRPVAYLRLQHGYASIELIGGDGSSEALPSAKSLEDGMRLAAERTRRWIVRADAGDEAALASSPLVRIVTLLTGVDEAAVVAAYGSVKSLARSLSGSAAPLLRVAAMGAVPEKAMPAGKRLADAITRFVGREVDTAVCSARIASARPSEVLFTGRTDVQPGAAMELLARVANETEVVEAPVRRVAAPVVAAPALVEEPEAIEEAIEEVVPVREVVAAREAASVPTFTPPPRASQRVAEEVKRPMRPEREPALAVVAEPEGERAEVLAGAPSALALLLPGLRPVSVRCPYAEGIEFAVDRAGTVHLLSRIEDGGEERALSQLLVAGAWADAHASMLAAALGQSAGIAASGLGSLAELHLFTDRPKASRRLLETSVNVHLLARVEVGGQHGWYCTDLN